MVSFKYEKFIPMKRVEMLFISDFVANFGGLFNLFMGASLLSIIEIIYYSTVRNFFAYKNQQKLNNKKRSARVTAN